MVLGNICGSLPYMSPEQLKGEVDYRSDLWSLGVILYELLTKELPFYRENEIEIIDKIRNGKFKKLDELVYPKWASDMVNGF